MGFFNLQKKGGIPLKLFELLGTIAITGADKAQNDIDKTSDSASSFGHKLGAGIGTVAKWGAKIATTAAAAAAAFGAMAVKAAAAYETNFAKVSTLLTGNEADMQKYKEALLQASTETGIAAEEMSEAVYSAISASVNQDDAIEFAKKASALAKGGFTDTATAVDVLTTAINAYGLSVDDTDKISDMLINTQNLGKTTVDELASSMGKIIPTANSFGVSLDVLCGSYAEITKNGIATAEATTYMNSMLNELGQSGTTASEVLKKKTNMSFKECMDSGMSLTDVLGILQNEADRTGVSMGDMFGSAEAGKAATVLQGNAEDLNKCIQSMGEASGTTQEAAAKMGDTVEARVNKMKNSLKNLTIQLGTALLPTAEKLMDAVEQSMPTIQALFEKITPIITGLIDRILPPLMDLAGQIFPVIVDLINQLLPPLTNILQTILPVITQLLTMLLPPITQIVSMILPLVVSLLQPILELLQPILTLLQPILDIVVSILEPLNSLLTMILQPLIELITMLTEEVLAVIQPIIEWLAAFLSDVLNAAIQLIIDVINNCAESFAAAWEWIKRAWQVAGQFFSGIWSAISGAFSAVGSFFKSVFSGAWNAVKSAFSAVGSFFKGVWNTIKNIFTSIGGAIGSAVSNAFSTAINWVLSKAIGIINGFISAINACIGLINKIPGVNISKLNKLDVPQLAEGGVLDKGKRTVVAGEDGAEAIVPLEKNTEWINKVAAQMQGAMGNTEALEDLMQQMIVLMKKILQQIPDSIDVNNREFARLVRSVNNA